MERRHHLTPQEGILKGPKWKRSSISTLARLAGNPALPSQPVQVSLVLLLCLITGYIFYTRYKAEPRLPEIPQTGRDPRLWFSKLRARLWTTLHYEEALREAYDNYAKNDRPCILSGLDNDIIILPPSAIVWLVNQSEQDVSTNESTKSVLQTRHTFPVPQIMDLPVHFDVIKGELTRHAFNLIPEITDEMVAAIDEIFGLDTGQWTSIPLFDSMTRIISRVSNRIFVGLPLCRNKAYLDNAIGFAEDIALSATLLRLFPATIRHIVAPIITLPNKLHTRGYTKIIKPEILRRQKSLRDAETEVKSPEADDFLSWLLHRSISQGSPVSDTDPTILIARLLHLNFASVHTTSFIGTNAILDLLCPLTDSKSLVSQLRIEALSVQEEQLTDESNPTSGMKVTRRGLALMHKTDSALRESSRLASIIGIGANHRVINPSGITSPDGTHCPYGSLVAVPSWGIHNDPAIYPDFQTYRPFRFAEKRDANHDGEYLEKANQSFVSTSTEFLGFGHGRHACPGRFFASQELKLLMAYLVLNYDMELQDRDSKDGGRPKNMWMGPNHVPPLKARIRVRHRISSTTTMTTTAEAE